MSDIKDSISMLQKIDFGSLLGAPLTACVEAQAQAASATGRYIEETGFVRDSDYNLQALFLSFDFTMDGRRKRITVPLISVVPLPYLQIDNVDIRFATDVSLEDGYLVGTVSSDGYTETTSQQQSTLKSDLRIRVALKASTSDIPYGLARVLEVMNKAMEVK